MLKVSIGNAGRSEVLLEFEGVNYTLRPEFQAVRRIEGQLDISALRLISRAHAGDLRLGDMAVILTECSAIAGKEIPAADIARMIRTEITDTSRAVGMVLNRIFEVPEAPAPPGGADLGNAPAAT